MESIEDRQARETNEREAKKKFLKQIITSAAKYERLMVNDDFKEVLSDLENVMKHHETEVKGFISVLAESTSIFKRMRIMEAVTQHQIRLDHLKEAVTYPQRLIQHAQEAREMLSQLKSQEDKPK